MSVCARASRFVGANGEKRLHRCVKSSPTVRKQPEGSAFADPRLPRGVVVEEKTGKKANGAKPNHANVGPNRAFSAASSRAHQVARAEPGARRCERAVESDGGFSSGERPLI